MRMKTAPVQRKDPLREKICYYMDDVNMPKEMHGRVAYLGSSRNYLGRIIVRGLRYLRERRLMEDFRNWNKDQGPC